MIPSTTGIPAIVGKVASSGTFAMVEVISWLCGWSSRCAGGWRWPLVELVTDGFQDIYSAAVGC